MNNPKQPATAGGNLTVRQMTRAELDQAIDWAAAEGWNPGHGDADCFYAADPGGFFVALLDGRPAGSISAVRYGNDFGFIGLFIVRPEHRGGRLGIELGKAALAHLQGRNAGLDGVLNKIENYRNFGFHYAHKNIRFEGLGGGKASGRCRPLSNFDFGEVAAYDAKCFGSERDGFLRAWFNQDNAAALGVKDSGRLAGYGVIRKCRAGCKIGPLFADSADIAAGLLDSLASNAAGEPFYLDVPEPNKAAIALAGERRMREVFATARMYSMEKPALPLEKVFGITTFELG